jgi:hypothetical protein
VEAEGRGGGKNGLTFTGAVFMVNGKMCVTAGDDRIMCRIDPALHDAEGMKTINKKAKASKKKT